MPTQFRNLIPTARFPAEKGRYALYFNHVCPWAHRALIVHGLKQLQDVVQLVEVDARDPVQGWYFSGYRGPAQDPITGVKWLRELYSKSDPKYEGRISIPILWDSKEDVIVNNESSEIMQMFIHSFDTILPLPLRETTKGPQSLTPPHLRHEVSALNDKIYTTINNGVYKVGFATSQASYDEHITHLFDSLDHLEDHLTRTGGPFLFGQAITETDIRLFTTLVRFDVAYYTLFKCNVKMIRLNYPMLHGWLRRLYWGEGDGVFRQTTCFDVIKRGYASVTAGNGVVPKGPLPPILPL